MTQLKYLSGLILNQPLLVTPDYAETLCVVLGDRMGISTEGMSLKPLEATQAGSDSRSGGTKVIPVLGSMTHRNMGLDVMSGQTSYEALQNQVEEAMADTSVQNILFDYNSGGGQVAGAFDFRDYLMDQRGRKPMYALARDTMCSAAYLLGSTADKVFTTQTGQVGSIGVVMPHVDESKADEAAGVKVTFFQAGAMKTAGNSSEELTDDTRAYIQESIDQSYDLFVSAIEGSRGLSAEAIRGQEARVYHGEATVSQGLTDGVMNYQEVLNLLAEDQPRVYQSAHKGNDMTEEEMNTAVAESEATLASTLETLKASAEANGFSLNADGSLEAVEAPEMIQVAGVAVDKATLPAAVLEALAEAEEAKADAALTSLAQMELPNFAEAEAKSVLSAVAGLTGEAKDSVMSALKGADAALASTMEEVGAVAAVEDDLTAKDKFNALVDAEMTNSGVDKRKATMTVTGTPEGKELQKLISKGDK